MIQHQGLSVSIYNAKDIHKKAKQQAAENQNECYTQDRSKASLYAIGKQNDVVYFKKDKRAMAPPKASGSFFGFLLMYTFHG